MSTASGYSIQQLTLQ